MCLRFLAWPAFGLFLAAALAAGCGYDWGNAQRIGSCANCEIIVKVEGIFDSQSVPNTQSLTWAKEPEEPSETSLLTNFNFRDDARGWIPEDNQTYRNAALVTSGSWQCLAAQEGVAYRFWASAMLTTAFARAGVSLEFFAETDCGGQSLAKVDSRDVVDATSWKTLSLRALAPTASKSMRARLFTVPNGAEAPLPALFDNAILRATAR